jgi:polar amino acid transport system substrate-binding protein
MKKVLSLVLALMMLLSLSAAAMADADYSKMSIDELKPELKTVTSGKLTVATSPDFAPYEFYAIVNGDPQLAGFDMALAQYIADYIGLELEVIPMDFDGVLNELASGGVDLGMAGLSPDPKRMDAMDFSNVYYQGGQSFVTVKANADKFKTLEDTNKAELSIGAQNGSIQMDLAQQNSPEADIVPLVKVTDIVAELLGGKLDGAYIETAVAENYAKSYPELAVVLEVPYESEGSAVGVVKGNSALVAAVNLAVAAALEDGSMDKFVAEANEVSTGATYEGLLDAEGAAEAIAEAAAK